MTRFKDIALHMFCWIIYLFTVILGAPDRDHNFWVGFISNHVPIIILFYINVLFIFPKYLENKNYGRLFLWLLCFNITALLARVLILMIIEKSNSINFLEVELSAKIWSQIRINLLFTGISLAFWYGKRSIIIERNQQRLEREISEARLMMLKNQINPHFLYNTLSFFYTKALPFSTELSDAIARLSGMMRYSLGESEENGKVPLAKEIEHLENFIKIHQLRFDNRLAVNFKTEGNIDNYKIMPLLLITFVENSFKHGKINDPANPILIHLKTDKGKLFFNVFNTKANGTKEKSSGIGLANIKSRLNVAYSNANELIITDNKETYSVTLQLNIK